jgi:hypothetical protein
MAAALHERILVAFSPNHHIFAGQANQPILLRNLRRYNPHHLTDFRAFPRWFAIVAALTITQTNRDQAKTSQSIHFNKTTEEIRNEARVSGAGVRFYRCDSRRSRWLSHLLSALRDLGAVRGHLLSRGGARA